MDSARPRRAGGFTLVELLVTLFVIALVAGIAVVRFGGSDRQEVVDREAMRLAQLLELAREEAVLAGEEWGFALTADDYRFLRLDEAGDRWVELEVRPFQAREMPAGTTLRLALLDRGRIGGQDTLAVMRGTSGKRPALLLLSSGEMTPFDLLVVPGDDAEPRRLGSDGFAPVQSASEPGP